MNQIILAGIVTEEPTLSHEAYGEKFYHFYLSSSRRSGTRDVLPCVASEVFGRDIKAGEKIKVVGEIRTYNERREDGRKHLKIDVFVKETLPYEKDENYVEMDGFLCREPKFRETPLGRQVTDLLVANNRPHTGKSDYIPAIAWGRMAIKSSELEVGTRVNVFGRLQSREYVKKLENGEEEVRVAYELSANRVDVVEKTECDKE